SSVTPEDLLFSACLLRFGRLVARPLPPGVPPVPQTHHDPFDSAAVQLLLHVPEPAHYHKEPLTEAVTAALVQVEEAAAARLLAGTVAAGGGNAAMQHLLDRLLSAPHTPGGITRVLMEELRSLQRKATAHPGVHVASAA